MIVVRLNGGLGNQMFQYAHGAALANKLNRRLAIDLTKLKGGNLHGGYCLDQYCLNKEVEMSRPNILRCFAYRYLSASTLTNEWEYVRERDFRFQCVKSRRDSKRLILDGYWQSERYFYEIRNKIISDFTPLTDYSGFHEELISEISSTVSVSLHVRRGDYISKPSANATHGVLPLQYYEDAIENILVDFPAAKFFVFSDDPDWIRNEFRRKIQHDFFCVSSLNSPQSSDLNMMSLCKHNIIANSSYSWWGAWLNVNPGKRVIAPKDWFRDSTINTDDLLPSDWLKI